MDVPVIHVNSVCVDSCLAAAKMAVEYRNTFKKDIFINLHCYRKHGHNEVDEPSFTNPSMYQAIRSRSLSPPRLYIQHLVENKVLTEKRVGLLETKLSQVLQQAYEKSDDLPEQELVEGWDAFKGRWQALRPAERGEADLYTNQGTGVPLDVLVQTAMDSVNVPEKFTVHDRLQKAHIESRTEAVRKASEDASAKTIDWATAESMAFGALLLQGFNVRLCGQDSKRGTFSHRHAAFTCQGSNE
jgi:probable 2-oxoglutarate dehydrogenase E1 component DHKTD1